MQDGAGLNLRIRVLSLGINSLMIPGDLGLHALQRSTSVWKLLQHSHIPTETIDDLMFYIINRYNPIKP